jgi:hypothetical protein
VDPQSGPSQLSVGQSSVGWRLPRCAGNSVVYLLGGRADDGGGGASVATYRIGTNTWSVPSFEPRLFVFNTNGVGRVGKLLYVSGGEDFSSGSFFVDRAVWAYDPAANTLTPKAPPPIPIAEGVTGVIGASLYVQPGAADTSSVPPVGYVDFDFRGLYRYNTLTDTWSTKRPSPHFHRQAAGGVIDGKLYVAGGRGNVTALDRYDPATNTWTTLAPLPVGGEARGAAILGKLLAVVGVGTTQELRAYQYDPAHEQVDPQGRAALSTPGLRTHHVERQAVSARGGRRPLRPVSYESDGGVRAITDLRTSAGR